jgi:hypothetical protein
MRPTDQLPQIIANLPVQPLKRLCYRVVDFAVLTTFDPMTPLYTLGPGKNGQRFTPKNGPNALYVSEDSITAQVMGKAKK